MDAFQLEVALLELLRSGAISPRSAPFKRLKREKTVGFNLILSSD
jgi:hypothetical protein